MRTLAAGIGTLRRTLSSKRDTNVNQGAAAVTVVVIVVVIEQVRLPIHVIRFRDLLQVSIYEERIGSRDAKLGNYLLNRNCASQRRRKNETGIQEDTR